MKKLILYLLLTIFLFSCSKDQDDAPQCTEVRGRAILFGNPDIYYLRINGVEVEVSKSDYLAHKVGAIYCY